MAIVKNLKQHPPLPPRQGMRLASIVVSALQAKHKS